MINLEMRKISKYMNIVVVNKCVFHVKSMQYYFEDDWWIGSFVNNAVPKDY